MNRFGEQFRVSVFGESHGQMLGVVLDGVPPGIELKVEDFESNLARRRAGAKGTTPRKEKDLPQLLSGVFEDRTTGAPLMIAFTNTNIRPRDYEAIRATPRPGHADFVATHKYRGFNDYRGGGHFSGRLTVLLVAAGVVAKKVVPHLEIRARLIEAGGTSDIEAGIDQAIEDGDSIGGLVECRVRGLEIGLGEPFFDSVESMIAHAVFAIPATKGIEFGSGFGAAQMKGSAHNDAIENTEGKTRTNNAGGINGGITNGNELVFRVAVKPTSSIAKTQNSLNLDTGTPQDFQIIGRHDVCIALRVPVVLEAVTALVLADLQLRSSWTSHPGAHNLETDG